MNTITKINLSNLKKCNQIWADMPETERGRLCLKCNNTIIDFRNLTDSEIAQTHVYSEQKICGIYKKEQLQKPKQDTKKIYVNNWKSFYFGLFSFLSFNSFGQEKIKPIQTEQNENKYDSIDKKIQKVSNKKRSIVRDSVIISGKLTNENSESLPFANVIIKGTRVGATSDFEGFYRLNITEVLDSLNKITLSYSYIGFETTEKMIDLKLIREEKNRIINIVFKEGEIIEFVAYERAPFHKRVWNGIKNIFRKKK